MNVLVTGALGFIGRNLCRHLLAHGHSVCGVSRKAAQSVLSLPGIKWVVWDTRDPACIKEALRGIDIAIHFAGENIASRRWTSRQKSSIHDSRVNGTRAIVLAINTSLVQTFICASAIGYYGDRGDEILDESSKVGTGFLSSVCVDWEHEALQCEKRTVCLRLGMVLGEDGGALSLLLPIFKLGVGGPIGSGTQWVSWVAIHDLVAAIEFIIGEQTSQQALCGPVNLVSPNPVTSYEFSKSLAHAVHRPMFFRVPSWAAKTLMGELSELFLASQKVIPRKLTESGFIFTYPRIDTWLSRLNTSDPSAKASG